jgi:hypothetical protein
MSQLEISDKCTHEGLKVRCDELQADDGVGMKPITVTGKGGLFD